jgi:hypothetical protein
MAALLQLSSQFGGDWRHGRKMRGVLVKMYIAEIISCLRYNPKTET